MPGIRIFFVAFGVLLLNLAVFGQKQMPQAPEPAEVSKPEISREESKPAESRPADPPARQESKPDTSSNNNNNNSRSSDSSSSRSSDSSSESSGRRNRDNDDRRRGDSDKKSDRKNDEKNKGDKDHRDKRDDDNRDGRDRKNDDKNKGDKDHRDKRDDDNRDGRGRKDDDKNKGDKDHRGKRGDDDRDGRRHKRDRDVYNPSDNDTYPPSSPPPFKSPFDKDDVFFDAYTSYIDTVAGNYQPFFEMPLQPGFRPLVYVYHRDFGINDLPFVSNKWVIYYEPDFDDVFINLERLEPVKYEMMVWYPVGKVRKVFAKSFGVDEANMRPTIVEKIDATQASHLFTFNVGTLPTGDYEMRLIAADGSTVKQLITIK